MSVIRAIIIGVTVVLASAGSAQANVVYSWRSLGDGSNFDVAGGTLTFSDAGYRSGSIGKLYKTEAVPVPEDYLSFPDSPILKASLQVVVGGDIIIPGLEVYPREGAARNPILYELNTGISFSGDLLTGMLSLVTDESQFSMSSDTNGLWTVDDFRSDLFIGDACGGGEGLECTGATGEWRLDRSTLPGGGGGKTPLPTPPVWSLFVLAVAGLFGVKASRSRRAKTSLAGSG